MDILCHFRNRFIGSVQSRIIFKLCSIAYQTLSSREHWYMFSIFPLALKPRELHSSGFHSLSVPRIKTQAGTLTFSVALPTLWNSLPERVKPPNSIICFRHHLKTHLFRLTYISQVSTPCLLVNFALYLDYEFV